METDETLYLKVKSGNPTAFSTLYERHKSGLYRFLLHYLKDRNDAEDVFHEAFLKVFQSAPIDFKTGTFRGWLYLVARNCALNRIRAQSRARKALIPLPVSYAEAEEHLKRKSLVEQIHDQLNALPKHLQEVLRLRLAGLANTDIAENLKIPVGTVKSRYHAIVALLKKEFENEE